MSPRLPSIALWTPQEVAERRARLVRASLRWWGRCVGLSAAAFVSLFLIERGFTPIAFALPFVVVSSFFSFWNGWVRTGAFLVVGAAAGFLLGPGAVLVTLAALLFGVWLVALLALFLSWGHWWLAVALMRLQELTDHVQDQTEQAMSTQGARHE